MAKRVAGFGLILSLLVLSIAAGDVLALPVAVAYPGLNGALDAPSADEQVLLDAIRRDLRAMRVGLVEWDAMISAVAREHSQDMADYDHLEYTTPRLGTIEYRLHRSGISASNARYVIFRAGSLESIKEQIAESGLHLGNSSHIGIGVVSKGRLPRRYFATLILIQRKSQLDRFPTMPLEGRAYRLSGTINSGFTEPELIITTPDGQVTQKPLKMKDSRQFDEIVRFDKGPGKYSVEIAVQGRLGAAILDLMHCYSGVPYPPPQLPEAFETPADNDLAEQAMLNIINRTRSQNGAPPLSMDPRITAVARKHSEDMLKNKFFAHVSPRYGDLKDRFARGGLIAKRFAENLASNRSLIEAHQGLMDSPGHRRNILDPDMSLIGIGIARTEDGQLLITENFMQPFEEYNTEALASQLYREINEARAAENLPPLQNRSVLDSVARENSKAMCASDNTSYETARRLLDQKSPRLKYIQMSVLKSPNPPKVEQVADVLNSRYSLIGIGIAQGNLQNGERPLYSTVLLGEK